MKRLACILFCILAINYTYAQTGSLVDSNSYGTIDWAFYSDGSLVISGSGDIADFNKSDESSPNINDRPWKKYRDKTYSLTIKEGVSRIGARAFQNFTKLKSAVIAESVKSIGIWAFQNCYVLEDISLGNDVVIENGAFRSAPVEDDLAAVESGAYIKSSFFTKLCSTIFTGNYRTDVINIALSQDGYHEGNSEEDYGGNNTEGDGDYTEYGRYLSSNGNAWCSEFASWCVRMSGLPKSILASSRSANAATFTQNTSSHYYKWSELIYGGGSYTPQAGDILLWAWDLDSHEANESLGHTSIFHKAVEDGDNITFYTIDGNSGNRARERTYSIRKSDGELINRVGRLYFLVAPDYDNNTIEKHQVIFDSAGGTCNMNSKTIAIGGLYGPLPIPIREGFDFLGWYTEPTGGKRVNMYHPVRVNNDQTLYAHWSVSSKINNTNKDNRQSKLYNLSGGIVDNAYKGIVIEKGRKRLNN